MVKFISFKQLFPRLYNVIPGLIKGTYYAITGATGTAKTKFGKFLFVTHSYKYCKANNIPLKIIYFALEESVENFWISIKCDLLYERFGETITYYQIMGYHEGLTPEIQAHLDSLEPEIEDMKKYIEVIDSITNPTGMYKKVRNVMNTLGKKTKEVEDKDENGNKWKSFEFIYDNPDTHVIVVVDHISLISPEKNPLTDVSTVHLAMGKWSEYVVRYICKKYNCIVCNIHQQKMDGDNEHTTQQNSELLLPALSKFADNLIIARDYMVVFGLFNPSRYKAFASNYKGFNMNFLVNKFRHLCLLKHRLGQDNNSISLLFNGKINYFEELPLVDDTEEINKVYKRIGIKTQPVKPSLTFTGLKP